MAENQADWNVIDTSSAAYIKNKPTIPSVPVTDVTVGGTSVLSNGTAVIPAIPTTVWEAGTGTNSAQLKNTSGNASGPASISAGGYHNTASGNYSHAEGYYTEAGGAASHSEGESTIASNRAEHAQGMYNKSNQVANSSFGNAGNTIHSVGIGTSSNVRKNAFEIMQNGDAYLYGVGSYNGANYSSASTLQSVINNAGGDTNVIETVKVNSTALTPDTNKAVDVTVPIEVINLGIDPVSAPSGTFAKCKAAISAGRTVALRVVDSEDNEVYYYYLHSTGVQYAGDWQGLYFSRVTENYIFYYRLGTNDSLTHSNKSIGTLTGVKFNNTNATINGTVAEITATIPVAVTESTVSGWGFTKNTGTYSKPSGGIPATDLESAVQTSLDKADTALQSFTETDPTVPSWAKQSTKPTYTASEVGALPDTTVIPTVPTNVSAFTNDANYVKYVLCADEATYNAISNKDSGTLYLIPKT